MVHITKVYTRKGDHGTTTIAANKRLAKTSLRISVIGDMDELNSFLGFSIQVMDDTVKELSSLKQSLFRIQNELFEIGAQLAVLAQDRTADIILINEKDIQALEKEIDAMNTHLKPLSSFILPGGSELASRLHLARSICRRTERSLVALSESEQLDGNQIPYMNRLSDWLFVAARYANFIAKKAEKLWTPRNKKVT